jgi:TatD DNase family protein
MSYADILRKNIAANDVGILPKDNISFLPHLEKKNRVKTNSLLGKNVPSLVGKEKKDPLVPVPLCHVDAGVNLTHKSFKHRVDKMLSESARHDCRYINVISSSVADSSRVVALVAEKNASSGGKFHLSCTVGVHPHEASRALSTGTDFISDLQEIIDANRDIIVAIGECGLDYNRNFSGKEDQKVVFLAQIALAKKNNLPLFLHERDAHEDLLACMRQEGENVPRGFVHCFTGNAENVQRYLNLGFLIGVTGWLCDDDRNSDLLDAIKVIPLDRIITETDAPYLTPKDLVRRPLYNGPQFIPHIVTRLSKELNCPRDKIVSQVWKNAMNFFHPV